MARSALYPPSVKPGIPRLGTKPKGWIETTFGEVLQVIQRPANIEEHIEYQLVTAKRGRGGIVPREKLLGKKILTKTQYYVAKDDFLISKRQIVHGACGVVPSTLDGALVSGEYSVLRVKDGLLLKYLDYFSHTDYFQMTCFQSSVGVDVEKMIFALKDWLTIKIYFPPAPEQKKIVDILNSWNETIYLTEKLIAAKQKLKKGLMQVLLTGKKKVDRLAGHWQDVTLEDCCDILDNQRIPLNKEERQVKKGNIPYYGANGVVDYIDEYIFNEPLLLMAEDGGFFSEASTRPICYLVDGKSWVNNHAHVLRTKKGVVREWVYYWFVHRNILSYINGGTRAKLNQSDLRSLPILLPSFSEQEKISSILKVCDSELDLLTKQLTALKLQKMGLMQKLLTGQTRVKV